MFRPQFYISRKALKINLSLSFSLVGHVLYEWSPSEKWRVVQDSQQPSFVSGHVLINTVQDHDWLQNSIEKARLEALKAIDDLNALRHKEM